MRIDFDPLKDAINQRKHGVSLAFGAEVLADQNRVDVADVRFDYGEDRVISLGCVAGRIWVCIFTLRDTTVRMISVRKANDRETQRYFAAPR